MLSLLGKDVITDLELLNSYQDNNSKSIIDSLSKYCVTNGSKNHMKKLLIKPLYNIDQLKNRQNIISNLSSLYISDDILNSLKNNEIYIDWFIDNKTENDIIDILDIVFFKFVVFRKLGFNDSSIILNSFNIYNIILSPLIGLLSPLTYFIIPFIVLKYKFKINIKFKTFINIFYNSVKSILSSFSNLNILRSNISLLSMTLSLFVYFQGLFNSYQVAKNSYKVCSYINSHITGVMNYIKSGYELLSLTGNKYDNIYNIMISKYDIGSKLIMYKKLDKNELYNFTNKINEILNYFAISKLNLPFVNFIENQHTTFKINNMYHISLDNPIKNSIKLENKNCLITGPNAGGKSTFLKALGVNIILAQTYGICCASSCELTPLYFINTQINTPDIIGKSSLFQEEIKRCKYNLDIISNISKDKHSLILLDELFNSTNVIEGVSAGYAILNKINSFNNCLCIVTTHFGYLTKLNKFLKYKMNAKINDKITFPYKLKKGVSNQYIALELLRNDFDNSIIDEAINIKNELVR